MAAPEVRLVHRPRLAQLEALALRIEARAILANHLVRALHRSERSIERAPRRVLERLAGLEHRLLADHSGSAHLFHLAGAVADDPVARDQLAAAIALVVQPDRVQEEPLAVTRVGVLGRITRLDLHAQALRDRLRSRHELHRVSSARTPTHSQLWFQSRSAAPASRAAAVVLCSRDSAK